MCTSVTINPSSPTRPRHFPPSDLRPQKPLPSPGGCRLRRCRSFPNRRESGLLPIDTPPGNAPRSQQLTGGNHRRWASGYPAERRDAGGSALGLVHDPAGSGSQCCVWSPRRRVTARSNVFVLTAGFLSTLSHTSRSGSVSRLRSTCWGVCSLLATQIRCLLLPCTAKYEATSSGRGSCRRFPVQRVRPSLMNIGFDGHHLWYE